MEFVPLQTVKESFVGAISSLKIFNDKYYIGTGMSQLSQILVFDSSGYFLYKLDKRGLGRDEYVEIKDFDIIREDVIAVVSHTNPRLLIYDLKKDTCILNKKMGNYPTNILCIDEELYIFTKNIKVRNTDSNTGEILAENNIVLKYDLNGNLLGSLFTPNKIDENKINYITPMKVFDSQDKKKVYFNYPWSNYIYEIDHNSLRNIFSLDFRNQSISDDVFENVSNILDIVKNIKRNKGLFLMNYFSVTEDYVYIQFEDYEENGYILFYDLKSKKEIKGHYLIDDLFFKNYRCKMDAMSLPKLLDGGNLIWCIDNDIIMNNLVDFKNRVSDNDWNEIRKKNERVVNVLEQMKEDDNPMIVKMKVKLNL